MKKLLVILSLAFAAVSFQVEAATLNLTNLTDASTDSGTLVINGQQVFGNFSHAWSLTSDSDTLVDGLITGNPVFSYALDIFVGATNVLSIAADNLNKAFNFSFLSTDVVTFIVSGSTSPFSKGNIDISVQAVPVPAAIWLFGSALMGLVGFSRRKLA